MTCGSWKLDVLQWWLKHCHVILFDGCRFGLRTIDGSMAIKKPWKMLSTNTALKEALHGRRCLKDHDHANVQGKDTEHTAGYPKVLCEKMVRVFLRSSHRSRLELQKVVQAMPAVRVRIRKKGKE